MSKRSFEKFRQKCAPPVSEVLNPIVSRIYVYHRQCSINCIISWESWILLWLWSFLSHHLIWVRPYLVFFLTTTPGAETLGGLGGRSPKVWGGGPCIRLPNILRSSVVGCARKYEKSKKRYFSCFSFRPPKLGARFPPLDDTNPNTNCKRLSALKLTFTDPQEPNLIRNYEIESVIPISKHLPLHSGSIKK